MYKKKGRKIYKISEARDALPTIVKDAPMMPSYIGKYGEATAVVVDNEIAEKYLPKEYLNKATEDPVETKFANYIRKLRLEKQRPGPKTNLSQRVDEILYGKKK